MRLKNKKGIILISCYFIVAILIIFGAMAITKTVSEGLISQRYNDTMKAFYIAEGGIETARKLIMDSPPSGTLTIGPTDLGEGNYAVTITNYQGNPSIWEVESIGTIPQTNINKTLKTIVGLQQSGSWETILKAIYSTGKIKITGNAEINPPDSYEAEAEISFGPTEKGPGTFGMTKDEMKARAHNYYENPPTNQLPVNKITWVEAPGGQFKVTDDKWVGTDILIVNGDFFMTGGTFSGVLWVIGNVKISGNAVFRGSIFVESGDAFINVDVTITGTPIFTYDGIVIRGAWVESGLITAPIFSWSEE